MKKMHPIKKKTSLPYSNKKTLAVYLILRLLVIAVMVRAAFRQDHESVFVCVLTLFLFTLPSIIQKKLQVEFPSTLEIIILLFIFAAEILGEISSFYTLVPIWDTMLHVTNGFLCAAVGFTLVDMLNRSERFSIKLSPAFLAVVAFCFSMTVGVLWEFYEYAADIVIGVDMQKDSIVHSINSVALDPNGLNRNVRINGIVGVTVHLADGTQKRLPINGYLDVGRSDTMEDLFVNFIGALVFSIIGYFYVKNKGRGGFASRFIPRVLGMRNQQRENGTKDVTKE
ncbi:MAG: hypothetical protein IJ418_22910 [Clostridia bacterium]|nr:hypothetical protein [Clostridia bacterium]